MRGGEWARDWQKYTKRAPRSLISRALSRRHAFPGGFRTHLPRVPGIPVADLEESLYDVPQRTNAPQVKAKVPGHNRNHESDTPHPLRLRSYFRRITPDIIWLYCRIGWILCSLLADRHTNGEEIQRVGASNLRITCQADRFCVEKGALRPLYVLAFCRCGVSVVEVAENPNAVRNGVPDEVSPKEGLKVQNNPMHSSP
jgi:hypothetical protein